MSDSKYRRQKIFAIARLSAGLFNRTRGIVLLIFGGRLRLVLCLTKNHMNPREFFINPADYGLPTWEELVAYRIWDNHFHGFLAKNPIDQYERNSFFVERMGIERSI